MTTPESWTDLGPVDDIPVQQGKYVCVDNRSLALFRLPNGQVRVMDDTCPHAGASLSAGHVADGCVICPWHAWAFELKTGQCPDNTDIAVRCYESRVVDGRVQARIG